MSTHRNTHWSFYLQWVLTGPASLLVTFPFAWALAIFVIPRIVGDTIMVGERVRVAEDYLFVYMFIPLYGLFLGLFQYFLLRRRLARMDGWVLITTAGWALAWFGLAYRSNPVGEIRFPAAIEYFLLAGTLLGLLVGFAQWLLIRWQVPRAIWWIPITALGFGIASLLLWNISTLLKALAAFTAPCLVTGIGLWLLLERYPPVLKREPSSSAAP